ncbi:MAG: M18 family aminopeptidase [Clostridiales bacterium]|nr:M18 family aminopeptidase [Clostridiales bacterium]
MNVKNLLVDMNKSKTPFHVVDNAAAILTKEGFERIREDEAWKLKKGGKYFVTKNDSALIAFIVGGAAFNIVAAHTDSPVFKIKAKASTTVAQFCKLNVESYGGGIYSTWFDRKLGIAGRILVKSASGIKSVLVDSGITVVIPNLAIHLNRSVNEGVAINAQRDMSPIIGNENITMEELFAPQANGGTILDYDLFLYVKEEPYFFGKDDCLIASSRLDDLEGVYGGLYALMQAKPDNTAVLALFDNEEVGSATKQGAGSTFLSDTVKRISLNLSLNEEEHMMALARSIMVSMDNAHGKHPNRPDLNDPTNDVVLNGGIVIKHHANQHYTTDGISSALIKNVFDKAGVKYQDFYMRSDLRCGGTLGAISSSQLSIRSVDIGLAQWAMHSAVESAGAKDFDELVKGLKAFFDASNELKLN